MHAPVIRPCLAADLAAVQAIYAPYVEKTVVSLETVAPSVEEMLARWQAVVERGLPYLVAETNGAVVGFAYAAPYHTRAGYRYTAENSIYICDAAQGGGIGRALMMSLMQAAQKAGRTQLVAAVSTVSDSANVASIAFHERLGFVRSGVLRRVGYKFDRWLDVVFLQRELDDLGQCEQ